MDAKMRDEKLERGSASVGAEFADEDSKAMRRVVLKMDVRFVYPILRFCCV
jgi:hypothetical protein